MYEYIKGKLVRIQPTYLVVDVSGIGFSLLVANPYRWQDYLNEEVMIDVELVTREDSQLLYGFMNFEEKELFQMLNKVSGIGPKSAMAILAADDHSGFINAVEGADIKYLTKFPGVGKKTAQQIILDLQGKLSVSEVVEVKEVDLKQQQILEEALTALEGLGYSKREINRVEKQLQEEELTTTQDALSLAFKLLIN